MVSGSGVSTSSPPTGMAAASQPISQTASITCRSADPNPRARADAERVINISGRAPGTAVSGGIRNIGTVNLTKSMANTLGPYGINVNAVYPGQTITEATLERYAEQARREGTTVEALHKAADERTLLKHVVTATDIGYVVAMLCSPLTVGVHGEAIGVDGGNRADMHY